MFVAHLAPQHRAIKPMSYRQKPIKPKKTAIVTNRVGKNTIRPTKIANFEKDRYLKC